MAINVDISKITGINQVGNSYQRKSAVPLDYFSLFNTKAEAVAYAASNPVSYVGQVISYIDDTDNGKVKVCVITDTAGTLREVGTKPAGDNKTIEVNTEGAISLLGATNAANGTLPMIDSETGKLVWKTLKDIGAGDGNDNTTYEFTPIQKGEEGKEELCGFKIQPFFNGKPIKKQNEAGEDTEEDLILTFEFDVYTKSEVDAAIKVVADRVGVPAEDDDSTDTLYERIAAEVLRATNAESALSERIGAAKDGETVATGVYAYVDGVVNALVNGVDPDKIDSLNELIAWVDAHPAIVEELDGRLDKVEAILDGIGDTENGEKATVKAYVDDAFDAHEQVADGKYATKQEIAEADYAVATEVANTYVTKETATTDNGLRFINQTEINKLAKLNLDNGEITISGSVNANQVKELYDTVVNIVKGSTADLDPDTDGTQTGLNVEEGAEVNIIETVQVNGTALTPDKDRAVNIVINSDTLTDGATLKQSITDAATVAQTGVDNAATAQGRADDAYDLAETTSNSLNTLVTSGQVHLNKTAIETLQQIVGTSEVDEGTLAARIGALETHDQNHAIEYNALAGAVGTNTSDIAALKGQFTEVTTVTIPGLNGALQAEITRSTGKDAEHDAAIAALQAKDIEHDGAIDALQKALAAEVERSTGKDTEHDTAITALRTDVDANVSAIKTIQGSDKTKSMREVAHEEASKVATAAMEFKGTTSTLPRFSTEDAKKAAVGNFYKVTSDITTNNLYEEVSLSVEYDDETGGGSCTHYWDREVPTEGQLILEVNGYTPADNLGIQLIGNGYDSADGTPTTDQKIEVPEFISGKATDHGTYILTYAYDSVGSSYTADEYTGIEFSLPGAANSVVIYAIGLSSTDPTDLAVIKTGDSIVWNGYMWYVIPSGDDIEDTWRPVTIAGTALSTTESLAIVAGNKIEIERNDDGAFVINAIAPDIPLATLTSNGDGALVGVPGLIKPVKDKFEVEAGEVTKISTDLLVNGAEELILYGGNAETGITA